ncbi:MAG TPA: enoyl-CoA hydratase [Pseudolysinimonas sp.]
MTNTESPVLYSVEDRIATITLNRPDYRNAQNLAMLYALDDAFKAAVIDDEVKVVVLTGAGTVFSAGHDIGSPGRDVHVQYDSRAALWPEYTRAVGAEERFAREIEIYLEMCRRWRAMSKPTIAMVNGPAIAGGLMLAWSCDLITASSTAYFADPVVDMGVPGVELFAHPWEFGTRLAKEMLLTGLPVSAERAYQVGMLALVAEPDELTERTMALARRIATKERFALALAKTAVNRAEDAMGYHVGIDSVFALHQLAHSHNAEISGHGNRGVGVEQVRAALRDHEETET